MAINQQNNIINVFSSHNDNPMKRGITHALALFCNNHIFAYLTLKITYLNNIKNTFASIIYMKKRYRTCSYLHFLQTHIWFWN